MTSDANPDAFLALLTLGLIDDSQHDAVLAHPETATLPPIPSPAHALAWMRVRGLITEEAQNAALEKRQAASPASTATQDPSAAPTDDTLDEAEDVVFDADDLVELASRGITHEAVNALYKDSLIDLETRDMALEETPIVGSVPAAPGVTLGWLVTDGPLEKELFEATRAQVAAEPGFAMTAERRRIVEEAQALIAADEAAMSARRAKSQRASRLGAWKFGLTMLVIAGGLGWYFFAPASVPACDAGSTRKTLSSLMVRVAMDARMRNLDPSARSEIRTPSISDMREVGYRKADRVRGCVAVMTQGADKDPMAYTIGPTSPKGDEMVVRGADVDIVQARFGHLDASGKPLYNADPIGREALEAAFRKGADTLVSQSSSPMDRLRERMRANSGLAAPDADREREIAEIEPTGPCRALEGGTGQACPLLIEYNDRLLGALSGGGDRSIPLTGEFTFVQDNGNWRVGDDFAASFVKAVTEGRMKTLGVSGTDKPH